MEVTVLLTVPPLLTFLTCGLVMCGWCSTAVHGGVFTMEIPSIYRGTPRRASSSSTATQRSIHLRSNKHTRHQLPVSSGIRGSTRYGLVMWSPP